MNTPWTWHSFIEKNVNGEIWLIKFHTEACRAQWVNKNIPKECVHIGFLNPKTNRRFLWVFDSSENKRLFLDRSRANLDGMLSANNA